MEEYSVEIVEASWELDLKEQLMYEESLDAESLDSFLGDGPYIFKPIGWVKLHVVNPSSKDGEYNQYIIETEDVRFITGSNTFFQSFERIYNKMKGYSGDWSVKAFRKPSSNFKDKYFITCSVV